MSTRYTELFRLPSRLLCEGCPLIIEAGTLLKDTVSGQVLAQLKLTNISREKITACKVNIQPFDSFGAAKQSVEYLFLDVDAAIGVPFGMQQAIYLSDVSSRSYDVCIVEIAFANGNVWKKDICKWEVIEEQAKISNYYSDDRLKEQFRIEEGSDAMYVPDTFFDFWRCTCGTLNLSNSDECSKCRRNLRKIMGHLDSTYLYDRFQQRQEENERREQERQARIREEYRLQKIEEEKRKEEARQREIEEKYPEYNFFIILDSDFSD